MKKRKPKTSKTPPDIKIFSIYSPSGRTQYNFIYYETTLSTTKFLRLVELLKNKGLYYRAGVHIN